jgi:hypothetical protein
MADREPLPVWLRALQWSVPVAFLFWMWWDGLRCWLMADDFAWLGLQRSVHNLSDFLNAMFSPMAQGTIRPWSERGFFMLFDKLFWLDSLPYRICVFTTAAADVLLLSALTFRLTRSRFASLLAPILWMSNAALADVMSWSSVYNEVLCPGFLLGGLLLLVRWIDTGNKAWWWWQLVVFVLGFGALETNVVYPALAAALVMTLAPRQSRTRSLAGIVPLFIISIAYFLIHRAVAPMPKTGVYTLRFDLRIFSTLALYWKWTMLPENWHALRIGRQVANVAIGALSGAVAAAVVGGVRSKCKGILFGPAWFLITLAPLLPLADHRTDYYLAIPTAGLAITAAAGVALAWKSSWRWRIGASAAVVLYMAAMIPVGRISARWWYQHGIPIRGIVLGIAQAQQNHPRRAIVIDRVTNDIYNDALAHSAWYAAGSGRVYVTAKASDTVTSAPDGASLESMILEPPVLRRALLDDAVVIYSVSGDHLRNVTPEWQANVESLPDGAPHRVEVGNPLFAYSLGPEWGPVNSGARLLPRQATVRLSLPGRSGLHLVLEGFRTQLNPKGGTAHLTVSAAGEAIGEVAVSNTDREFRRRIDMMPPAVGKIMALADARSDTTVTIRVDSNRVPEGDSGLALSLIAFEP